MDAQELTAIERRWTGRQVDYLQPQTIADCLVDGVRDVHALLAEVRRCHALLTAIDGRIAAGPIFPDHGRSDA